MALKSVFFWLGILAAAPGFSLAALAGGEEKKAEKKAEEWKPPEDTPMPREAEQPEPGVGEDQEPVPSFDGDAGIDPAPAAPAAKRRPFRPHELDDNIDYSSLLTLVETSDPSRGVLAPAQGFRGYRPNMIAASAGDRTPGFGGLIEYNWNRLGAGIFASYRNTKGEDERAAAYGVAGVYCLYRWLPFDVSPYILLGLEAGSQTMDPLGGLGGLGVEAHVYAGLTALVGWTYHSTVRRGFMGGALGWSF